MSDDQLVCPKCGSEELVTREIKYAWGYPRLTRDGLEWDGSSYVGDGDFETDGILCASCLTTWHLTGGCSACGREHDDGHDLDELLASFPTAAEYAARQGAAT